MNIAILYWEPFDSVSGSRIYTAKLAKSLREKNNNVFILTTGTIIPYYEGYMSYIYTIDADPSSERGFYQYFKFCLKMVKKWNIDIIHTNYNHAFVVAEKIKHMTGTPYFITLHGFEYKWALLLKSLHESTKKALNSADQIFTASMAVARKLADTVGVELDDRYVYLPNAVDEVVTTAHNQTAGQKIILFVGRLAPEKGLPVVFEAMNYLKHRSEAELQVVGDGELREWCEEYIRNHALADCIRMIGERRQTEVRQRMADSDVIVIPSIFETMPTVLLEAMLAGKPIVASKISGIENVIADRKEGMLAEKGNAAQFAEKIDMLLEDRQLCEAIGSNARNKARAEYLWGKIVDRLMRYYTASLSS